VARSIPLLVLVSLLLGTPGCRRPYRVGDHVLVEWRGDDHPAVIVAIEGPSKFRVHYDGYSDDWDESVTAIRIQGRLGSTAAAPMPNAPARPRAGGAASAQPPSVYKAGDRVRVEWHGSIYSAKITTVLGGDRYRVHYEGYGDEWDENIGLNRLQRK
jgi:hypothetical protein